MRTLLTMVIVSSAATAWADDPSPRYEERGLSAKEVERYAAPYLPAIKSCYLAHGKRAPRATGELSLRLLVHRDGGVERVEVTARGVVGKRLLDLSQCIRSGIGDWHFPARRDQTTAILPYYFLKLDLPAAGPQLSCWNPRGCKPGQRY
jgi:hypothetical protein